MRKYWLLQAQTSDAMTTSIIAFHGDAPWPVGAVSPPSASVFSDASAEVQALVSIAEAAHHNSLDNWELSD